MFFFLKVWDMRFLFCLSILLIFQCSFTQTLPDRLEFDFLSVFQTWLKILGRSLTASDLVLLGSFWVFAIVDLNVIIKMIVDASQQGRHQVIYDTWGFRSHGQQDGGSNMAAAVGGRGSGRSQQLSVRWRCNINSPDSDRNTLPQSTLTPH